MRLFRTHMKSGMTEIMPDITFFSQSLSFFDLIISPVVALMS